MEVCANCELVGHCITSGDETSGTWCDRDELVAQGRCKRSVTVPAR